MVNKSHVHAIVMNKNRIIFCASLIYLNTFKFLALYIVEIIMEGVYSVIILKKPIVKMSGYLTHKEILQPNCLNTHPFCTTSNIFSFTVRKKEIHYLNPVQVMF